MTYPYKQARYDYGVRRGPTLALCLHMTEGAATIEAVDYLAGNPARGVSANFVSLGDGTIYQMLPIDHASGSLHPGDISTSKTKPYYNGKYLKACLPDPRWRDPNSYIISIEIGGHAADGPNPAQVAAVIAWGLDMRRRYPSIVGAFGHADQTDQKGCPGITPAMKSIFAGIGGHGLFAATAGPAQPIEGDTVYPFSFTPGASGAIKVSGLGHSYLNLADGTLHPIADGTSIPIAHPGKLGKPLAGGLAGADRVSVYVWTGTSSPAALLASDVIITLLPSDAAAGYASAKADALAAVEAIAPKP